jgi:membrane protease YdiL (CAAX protease family)
VPSTPFLVYQAAALAFAFVGCVLLWRLWLSPAARLQWRTPPLPTWDVTWLEFVVFALVALSGYVFGGWIGFMFGKAMAFAEDAQTIVGNAGAHLGMLLGVVGIRTASPRAVSATPPERPNLFLSGAATFLITLPVVMLVTLLTETTFKSLGWPVVKQDSVAIFIRSDSPWLGLALAVLAVAIAPVTEELAFRAGLFRYVRTRLPRVVAVLLPAILFASLHITWKNFAGLSAFPPLVALAVVFSLAYERTGRIGTTMVAHALFNLNSVLFILAGGGKEP